MLEIIFACASEDSKKKFFLCEVENHYRCPRERLVDPFPLKVANFCLFQKMCNVLKRMQNQFSDFYRLAKFSFKVSGTYIFCKPDSETLTSAL